MSKRVLSGLCCALVLGVAVGHGRTYRTGLLHDDLGKVAPEREVRSIPAAPGAKSFRESQQTDLSDEVPPVGLQGNQGSCTSWATGYYHWSQLEYRERHWDLTDAKHQFSPAFLYNQVNGGADQGSGWHNMQLICEQGCASMADCPYDQYDYVSWPSESAYSHATAYRAKSWSWFHVRDSAGVNMLKQLLANGSTAVLYIWAWENLQNIHLFDNNYCAADRYGANVGGHSVAVVGYDDTLTTHDGVGAFRCVNSWSDEWGDHGFFWMSYEAVVDDSLSIQQACFLTDTVGYEPQLLARVHIDHPTRDRLGIEFRVGPYDSPLWSKQYRTYRQALVDQPFPDNNIVFDLTEGASYIAGGQTDSVYLVTWDSWADDSSGTVRCFSAQYLPWGNVHASTDTPVVIPDDGTWVYAGTRVRRADYDAGPVRVVCPSGVIAAESTYTPQVKVRNFGLNTISFPVRLSISAGYADSAAVSDLAPGDSMVVEFSPWTSPARGPCPVRCTTALAGDEFAGNDVRCETAEVYYRDIAVVELTSPPDTVDSGQIVKPQARVRNNGTQEETFLMWFRIPDEGYERFSIARSLPPGRDTTLTFASWAAKLPGSHACGGQLVVQDMDPTNDVASGTVYVRPGAGIARDPAAPASGLPGQTVVRGMLRTGGRGHEAGERTELLDITGRSVMELRPGANDLGQLGPGVYFVRSKPSAAGGRTSSVNKVIVTR